MDLFTTVVQTQRQHEGTICHFCILILSNFIVCCISFLIHLPSVIFKDT